MRAAPQEARCIAGDLRTAWNEDPGARMALHRMSSRLHAGGGGSKWAEDVLDGAS